MKRSRRLFKLVVLIAASWLGAVSLHASGINLSQSIDRTEIGYDDQVKLEIILEWPGPPSAYLIAGPIRPKLDRLKVASTSSTVSVEGQGETEKTTKRFRFFLEPTSSGVGKIDRIEIRYLSMTDSDTASVSTDPLEVKIGRPALNTSSEDESFSWPFLLGMAVLALSVIVGGLFYLRRKRSAEKEPKRTPEQELLAELTELKAKASSDHKQFQTGLYRILVSYLGTRSNVIGQGHSCESIIEQMVASDMPLEQSDRISGWLKKADKEKYSPAGAPPGETTRIEAEVRTFFELIASK